MATARTSRRLGRRCLGRFTRSFSQRPSRPSSRASPRYSSTIQVRRTPKSHASRTQAARKPHASRTRPLCPRVTPSLCFCRTCLSPLGLHLFWRSDDRSRRGSELRGGEAQPVLAALLALGQVLGHVCTLQTEPDSWTVADLCQFGRPRISAQALPRTGKSLTFRILTPRLRILTLRILTPHASWQRCSSPPPPSLLAISRAISFFSTFSLGSLTRHLFFPPSPSCNLTPPSFVHGLTVSLSLSFDSLASPLVCSTASCHSNRAGIAYRPSTGASSTSSWRRTTQG